MVRKVILWVLFLLILAGCGGGTTTTTAGSTDTTAGETTTTAASEKPQELTVTIPFPSGVAFYPLYVAQDRGYFEEEGLSVKTEPVDGSGAVIQQIVAGQAEVGFPSPGPFLQAVNKGTDLLSVYTLYQSNVFSLVTPAGSDIHELSDLRGKTVGVGTLDGGETAFTKALLSDLGGLKDGTDYQLLAVGDGGTAYAGLNRGDVAAYAAAFPDVATLRLRGMELRNLVPAEFSSFFDSLAVVKSSLIDEKPDLVKGFGKALAKATVWGMDNPEGVLDITAKYFPEEAQDREFSLALLKETQSLFVLPEAANGKWGTAVPAAVDTYMNYLVKQGELAAPVDTKVFVNDFVDFYSNFDKAKL